MKAFLRVLLVIFIGGSLVRIFLIDSFSVSGDSMAPTIQDGDYVFISKLAYWRADPARGDIVVSTLPGHTSQHIIKRVIALPGERIQIAHDRVSLKNNREDQWTPLEEKYIHLAVSDEKQIKDLGITYINIDPKEYFAMGDNRMVSIDSRELGAINRWDIKGKVVFKISFKSGLKASFY